MTPPHAFPCGNLSMDPAAARPLQGCWLGPLPRWKELYALARGELCHGNFTVFLNGQFVATGKAIKRHRRGTYAMLHRLLLAPPDHWVHDDLKFVTERWGANIQEDTLNAPLFLFELERLWGPLFGCSPNAGYEPYWC